MAHTPPDLATQRVSAALFESLRRMDAEATTICAGKPTGLSSYGYHAYPKLKRPQTEPAWSKRLADLLTAAGLPAKAECRYPGLPGGKRNSCDVVVELGPDRLWIEVKGAWRDYWVAKKNLWLYRSYLLHPLVSGLDAKTHTVPLDLQKLKLLTPTVASHVGVLLVGFEEDVDPMAGDVDELVTLAKLGDHPWTTFTDHWSAHHQPGHTVRCWMWTRRTV